MSIQADAGIEAAEARFRASQAAKNRRVRLESEELASRALPEMRRTPCLLDGFALLARALQDQLLPGEAKNAEEAESCLRKISKELRATPAARARVQIMKWTGETKTRVVEKKVSNPPPASVISPTAKRRLVEREIERHAESDKISLAFTSSVWRAILRDLAWLEEQRALAEVEGGQ